MFSPVGGELSQRSCAEYKRRGCQGGEVAVKGGYGLDVFQHLEVYIDHNAVRRELLQGSSLP